MRTKNISSSKIRLFPRLIMDIFIRFCVTFFRSIPKKKCKEIRAYNINAKQIKDSLHNVRMRPVSLIPVDNKRRIAFLRKWPHTFPKGSSVGFSIFGFSRKPKENRGSWMHTNVFSHGWSRSENFKTCRTYCRKKEIKEKRAKRMEKIKRGTKGRLGSFLISVPAH